MKTFNNGLLIVCASLLLTLTGCATTPEPLPENLVIKNALNLTNSKWSYSDSELSYEIEFLPDGMIRSSHPHERTPNDDKWEQSDHVVNIYLNNRYSILQGKLLSPNQMTGSAKNEAGEGWEWKASRIK